MFPPPSKRRHYRERTIETPSRTSEVNREVEERNRQRAEEKRRDTSGIKLMSHSFMCLGLITIRNHSHHSEESEDSHRHSSSHHRSLSRESSHSRRTEKRDREWRELTKDRADDDEWEEATPLTSIRHPASCFSFLGSTPLPTPSRTLTPSREDSLRRATPMRGSRTPMREGKSHSVSTHLPLPI